MASFQVTLTPEEAASLLAKFGASGTLPDGVSLSTGNFVTFTIVKKPFYVSVGQIEHHVRGLLGL